MEMGVSRFEGRALAQKRLRLVRPEGDGHRNAVSALFSWWFRIVTSGRLFEKFFGSGRRKNYEDSRDVATALFQVQQADDIDAHRTGTARL
jgi:hypothetical protein